jgi:hypothetical protein
VGGVSLRLVPPFYCVSRGEINFVGFFPGKIVDQLDKYFLSHGGSVLFSLLLASR